MNGILHGGFAGAVTISSRAGFSQELIEPFGRYAYDETSKKIRKPSGAQMTAHMAVVTKTNKMDAAPVLILAKSPCCSQVKAAKFTDTKNGQPNRACFQPTGYVFTSGASTQAKQLERESES